MLKRFIGFLIAAGVLAVPYGLFVDNAAAMTLINALRGILAISLLYVLFINFYSLLRKKIERKYMPEVVTIASVLILSAVCKFLVIIVRTDANGDVYVQLPANAWESVVQTYYALYQAVGGLSFEGLNSYDSFEAWRTVIYSASSLLAGAVAISILSFSISYELYSAVSWSGLSRFSRVNAYVFTSVTEDSVMLAHSIDAHERENGFCAKLAQEREKHGFLGFFSALYRTLTERHAIIFLRTNDQDGFDSKNPLHLDIMRSGFLFRSYNPGRKEKSVASFLRLKVVNDGCLVEGKDGKEKAGSRRSQIHIFALDWEKGKTCENDKIVFEDISRVMKETLRSRPVPRRKGVRKAASGDVLVDKLRGYGRLAHYYYLSSEEIDTANVDMRFDNEAVKLCRDKADDTDDSSRFGELAECVLSGSDKCGKMSDGEYKTAKAAYVDFKKRFVITALNEANMAAFSYIRKRGELITHFPEVYAYDVNCDSYNAIAIGFGQNGQQTLKAAYVFAAAGKHGEKSDKGNASGAFSDSGRQWLDVLRRSYASEYKPQPFYADVYDKNASDIGGLFRMKHPAMTVDLPDSRRRAYRYDDLPVRIVLHHESVYGNDILKLLDSNAGLERDDKNDKRLRDYNLVIIALGDDDRNVNVANALLEDSKREFRLRGGDAEVKRQVFAVNLRDRLNYDRINWCCRDEAEFPYVKVILFGSAEEMYSYRNIVDVTLAKKWNYGYSCIADDDELMGDMSADITAALEGLKKIKTQKYFSITEQRSNDLAKADNYWYDKKDSMFYERFSSRCAAETPAYFAAYARARGYTPDGDLCGVDFCDAIAMGATEHDRWERFLVSCGYDKCERSKDNHVKLHGCLKEYRLLDTQPYDIVNVLNALKTACDAQCAERGVKPVYLGAEEAE